MILEIEIPEYNKNEGMHIAWEKDFSITSSCTDGKAFVLKANREGLISLAKQLLTLAQVSIPAGYHIHYDETNSLEAGSCPLIIEKE